jgi:anti-sigma regulatory factor (Ser/Thr protein kinase)
MDQGDRVPLVSTLALAGIPRVVHWAREHVACALSGWGLSGDIVDVARLVTSELVTNAIHVSPGPDRAPLAGSGPDGAGRVCVTVRFAPGRLVIEVFDHDLRSPVLADEDADAESGRGLVLVQALSKEWGHFFPPAGGKTVFAVIGLDDSACAPNAGGDSTDG